jgi:MYXO-CTERM domain-containing protein
MLFTTSGVGIGALWRRSPPLAAGLMAALLVIGLIWTVRRRHPEAVG